MFCIFNLWNWSGPADVEREDEEGERRQIDEED